MDKDRQIRNEYPVVAEKVEMIVIQRHCRLGSFCHSSNLLGRACRSLTSILWHKINIQINGKFFFFEAQSMFFLNALGL